MCGIVGWINYRDDLRGHEKVLTTMANALEHRGPDEEGYYFKEHCALGHKRLIVVDPEGGKQPMTRENMGNHYTIVYNGELYNTEDLRKELLDLGYTFNSYSDTEVLLKSYIQWGIHCLPKLNGIYAFAIFNDEKEDLFLARDPLGVKPLFYTYKRGQFMFASEIKALLKHPLIEPIVNEKGILELMGIGPGRSHGLGVFKDIKEVMPGYFMYFRKDLPPITKEFWQLVPKKHEENYDDTVEHLRSLVLDAIQRQLVADVKVCTFLSGGLDSSIISAISAEAMKDKGYDFHTYSIDYEENEKYFKGNAFQPSLDHVHINKMVEDIGSSHHNIVLKNEALIEALENAVLASDLPVMADIDSSLYLFCKEVRKSAVVGLSGECADEIFGGYPWFNNPEDLRRDTFPWSRYVGHRQKLLSPAFRHLPLTEYVHDRFTSTVSDGRYTSDKEEDQLMQRMTYLNIKGFMQTLLNRKDRMSMANSLEVRVPFADPRIVEYAYNIPWEMKSRNGLEKGILREAVKGIVPEEIRMRKKNPYPKTHHPRYLELITKKMEEIMKDSNAPIHQLLDYKEVKHIVDTRGEAFEVPWYGQLMTGPQVLAYFYQLNFWLKEYDVKLL